MEWLLKGGRASFSQLCRLSFAFLLLSLLVVAGGGLVALSRDHEAKLLCASQALDDGAKVFFSIKRVPSPVAPTKK